MSNRSSRSGTKMKGLKTFTYFIPAPPHRKNGYREVEFDKIMQGILNSGFELVNLQTQTVANGMFVIALLKFSSKKVAGLDENLDIQERYKLQDTHHSPEYILEREDD